MKRIENGACVKLCYTVTPEDEVVFDKTQKCKPLEIRVGEGQLLQGVESELIGMGLNEKKSFILGPDEAYGERNEELERTLDRSSLQLTFDPYPGQVIVFHTMEGQELPALVKSVDDEMIVADFNHPLAGRYLAFEVEVAGIGETRADCRSSSGPECRCP
ncbi:MAG: peptidylprolyl isomerase [Syntrophobacteraceae bacterium]|jgi:FKBP-type peptidyl-prolyl cis-trans isomerase 2